MKIKAPRKQRKLSDKFLARKAKEAEDRKKTLPEDGPVRLFLDDERDPPQNYTLVRSPHRFLQIISELENGRITEISLDWYLGPGIMNGEEVVENFLRIMKNSPEKFAKLERVTIHSSNLEASVKMAKALEIPVTEEWHSSLEYFVIIK